MTADLTTTTPPGRRAFGTVFALPNGKFQARYRRDGRAYKKSFRTERQADQFLTREQGKLNEGTWASPAARRLTFEQATAGVPVGGETARLPPRTGARISLARG